MALDNNALTTSAIWLPIDYKTTLYVSDYDANPILEGDVQNTSTKGRKPNYRRPSAAQRQKMKHS